jgi:hypothetical protein
MSKQESSPQFIHELVVARGDRPSPVRSEIPAHGVDVQRRPIELTPVSVVNHGQTARIVPKTHTTFQERQERRQNRGR